MARKEIVWTSITTTKKIKEELVRLATRRERSLSYIINKMIEKELSAERKKRKEKQ